MKEEFPTQFPYQNTKVPCSLERMTMSEQPSRSPMSDKSVSRTCKREWITIVLLTSQLKPKDRGHGQRHVKPPQGSIIPSDSFSSSRSLARSSLRLSRQTKKRGRFALARRSGPRRRKGGTRLIIELIIGGDDGIQSQDRVPNLTHGPPENPLVYRSTVQLLRNRQLLSHSQRRAQPHRHLRFLRFNCPLGIGSCRLHQFRSMEHFLGLLRIHVRRGVNLAIRDVRSSDPYVVIRMGKQVSSSPPFPASCFGARCVSWNTHLIVSRFCLI